MQRKPIANKYRKGTMKSTLHSTYVTHAYASALHAIYVQAPTGVKERVKSPYRQLYTSICLQSVYMSLTHTHILYTAAVNIFLFSEVQSDRASLHHFYDGSELLRTITTYAACSAIFITQDATIRPVLKHGPRSSTGLRVVEFITKLQRHSESKLVPNACIT